MRLVCRFTADPRSCSKNAREKFRRYGLSVLCVAKFVPGLDAVMPPLSGAEGVSLAGFLALDAVGSFLWSGFYVGLGYLFSNELDVAIRWAQHFGTALGIAIGVPIVLYAGWRGLTLVRMIRRTTAAPHQSADARTQTEIQKESRGARPVELRRRNRQ